MQKKRNRKNKLILIFIILGNQVGIDLINNMDSAYAKTSESQLTVSEAAAIDEWDNLYKQFDISDDPENFDENGDLQEVNVDEVIERVQYALNA